MSQPANLVFIMADQHHPRGAGYRGHPHVQTPNRDRLAREGAHFTRSYCTNPVCTPSRMSMITGQYTHRIGVPDNGFPLARAIMTWPRRLDQAGIATTMLGKLDLCGEYQDAGFTHHRIIRRRPVHPAMSMVVHDNLKYTWYSNGEFPTLFDLAADPHELHNVATAAAYASGLQTCHQRLLSVCDPEAESRRAKTQLGLLGPEGESLTQEVV